MTTLDAEAFIEAYRDALRAMARGDNAPAMLLYSRRDDVTLANPLGSPVTGWANIARVSAAVAASFAGGTMAFEEVTRFVAPDFAYTVGFEHVQGRRAGSDESIALSLRVTTIFRREEDGWKVAHRHADRIVKDQRASEK